MGLWRHNLIDESGLKSVRDAVALAERTTSAEIVPMVVRSSVSVGHVPILLFLIFCLIFEAVIPSAVSGMGQWASLLTELAALPIAWVAALILAKKAVVQRILTSRADQASAVNRRALLEFHLSQVNQTTHRSGVLLMVSLLERRAVVIADREICTKLQGHEPWHEAIQAVLSQGRRGNLAEGMVAAIERIGQRLEAHFPSTRQEPSELPDQLVIKD